MKKKFGLSLACKIASQAIEKNMAAPSIVIGNLFILEKSSVFPDDLDEHFFVTQKVRSSDQDVRRMREILEAFKAPGAQKYDVLLGAVSENWSEKKKPVVSHLNNHVKQKPLKRVQPKIIAKKTTDAVTPPVIIVKRKLGV